MLVGILLLVMDELQAFWVFVAIMEELMPTQYYSSTLLESQADQRFFFFLFFF
jgi:hypothetical protein